MTIPHKTQAAPALFRLLADSALSRAALAAAGFPLALVDAVKPNWVLTYVNPAFESFFGHAPGEVIGRRAAEVLLRGDEACARELFDAPSSGRRLIAWRKDGTAACVEVAVGSVFGAEGQRSHWVVTFADRTETESLREQVDALKARGEAALPRLLRRQP